MARFVSVLTNLRRPTQHSYIHVIYTPNLGPQTALVAATAASPWKTAAGAHAGTPLEPGRKQPRAGRGPDRPARHSACCSRCRGRCRALTPSSSTLLVSRITLPGSANVRVATCIPKLPMTTSHMAIGPGARIVRRGVSACAIGKRKQPSWNDRRRPRCACSGGCKRSWQVIPRVPEDG